MPRFRVTELGTYFIIWEVKGKDKDDIRKNVLQNLEIQNCEKEGKELSGWEIEELKEGEDA